MDAASTPRMDSPPASYSTPPSPVQPPQRPLPVRTSSRTSIWLAVLLFAGVGVGAGGRWILDGPAPMPKEGGDSAHPAAQQPVLLTILTEPADATVMVDGVIAGQSPIRQWKLPAGVHGLRIEKDGFTPAIQPLDLTDSRQLHVVLTPVAYARLEIAATPAGAEVWVDGAFRGVSPMVVENLPPGFHDLLVQKPNFTSHQSRQMLRAGEVRRIADITLDNLQLLMLKANLEINPRSIGNNLDLAHFHYINNEMARAVKYYMRARELAALPMPPPLPDTPQDEVAFLPQLFQDEIRRVKTEEDHHLINFHEYYGTALDFDTFKRLYVQGMEAFKLWSEGIRSLAWVVEQAEKLQGENRLERRAELFSDLAHQRTDCGPAVAGWAAAELARGHVAEGADLYARAKVLLEKPEPPETDKPFVARAWYWLGVAWRGVSRTAGGKQQGDALANAGLAYEKAIAHAGDNKFLMAEALYQTALLARDRGDKTLHAALLRTAFEVIKSLADNSRANPDSLARCLALQHAIQYSLAYASLEENKPDVAVALLREVAANVAAESPLKEAARHAVELLDSGKTPTDPLPRP